MADAAAICQGQSDLERESVGKIRHLSPCSHLGSHCANTVIDLVAERDFDPPNPSATSIETWMDNVRSRRDSTAGRVTVYCPIRERQEGRALPTLSNRLRVVMGYIPKPADQRHLRRLTVFHFAAAASVFVEF